LLGDFVAQFCHALSAPVPLQAMFLYGVRPAISERHIDYVIHFFFPPESILRNFVGLF
jgi:hypothetical protein